MNLIEQLKEDGFEGFVPVHSLRESLRAVPKVMGVYVVLRTNDKLPEFFETGTGGAFKGKNPNESIDKLNEAYIMGTPLLYIGKAGDPGSKATLYKRLKQYMEFGQGKAVGHWGGRYIWQLKDADDLVFAWKPLPFGHPSKVESEMIAAFKILHGGKRPFANLKD